MKPPHASPAYGPHANRGVGGLLDWAGAYLKRGESPGQIIDWYRRCQTSIPAVAVNEVASARIALRPDDYHPDSSRGPPQIIEPGKTVFVVEVSDHDQRSEVGVLEGLQRSRSAAFRVRWEANQFQLCGELCCPLHFRI
jgi:hypothetical protein